jgi:hypothetical protein
MVNKLISNTKKVFLRAPLRREVYTEKCPNLKLPPEPVLTRWGTLLETAVFYQENFRTIKDVRTYVIPLYSVELFYLNCRTISSVNKCHQSN